MLSERSQTQEGMQRMSPLICQFKKDRATGAERRLVVCQALGVEKRGSSEVFRAMKTLQCSAIVAAVS